MWFLLIGSGLDYSQVKQTLQFSGDCSADLVLVGITQDSETWFR